ncbi:MAG: zinc-binding dehydrogenase [Geminicoccaceae bacterium]
MQGVVFLGDRELEIRHFDDPTPGQVRSFSKSMPRACAAATSSSTAREGAKSLGFVMSGGPVIAGHEPCGVVVAVGPGVPSNMAWPGMRAMQHHYDGCGTCPHCKTGWMQMCDEGVKSVFGITANGAHARYMKCPAHTLVALPEELSFRAGAAISCGTGTAWGALERLGLRGNHTIAVFGQGPVGLSATQLAHAMGARVIALDTDKSRLERAREFGADAVIDPSACDDVPGAIRELTHGLGVECSLDTSSAPSARRDAVRSLRKWGSACLVGEGGNVELDVSNDMLRRQATVIGSWTFSTTGQSACARYIADRGIDIDALFTHEWKIEDAARAYELFDAQSEGKGVFLPAV